MGDGGFQGRKRIGARSHRRDLTAQPVQQSRQLGVTAVFQALSQRGNRLLSVLQLQVQVDELRNCAVKQLFHFAMGRQAGSDDQAQLDRLGQSFKASGDDFRQLVADLVTDPNFQLRIDTK